jgi:sugar/nucleoside kinase (ribokinase family)
MYDICCIGHITSDKVVTPQAVRYVPGGTAFYFSCALSRISINYLLVTALAQPEMHYVNDLREKGIEVKVQPSAYTVYFENIYGENLDDRSQNVLQTADAFTMQQLQTINAKIFHLGPLLADDMSAQLVKDLAKKGRISLDVQGYLRKVKNKKVYATGWTANKELLPYVDILKADFAELQALTGEDDVHAGVKLLAQWGVKEIVITNGSKGSLIYNDGTFYTIRSYQPQTVVDTTGCGDTYMAGYLFRRINGDHIQQAGEFAAAMSGLKAAISGPFTGTEQDVELFRSPAK